MGIKPLLLLWKPHEVRVISRFFRIGTLGLPNFGLTGPVGCNVGKMVKSPITHHVQLGHEDLMCVQTATKIVQLTVLEEPIQPCAEVMR